MVISAKLARIWPTYLCKVRLERCFYLAKCCNVLSLYLGHQHGLIFACCAGSPALHQHTDSWKMLSAWKGNCRQNNQKDCLNSLKKKEVKSQFFFSSYFELKATEATSRFFINGAAIYIIWKTKTSSWFYMYFLIHGHVFWGISNHFWEVEKGPSGYPGFTRVFKQWEMVHKKLFVFVCICLALLSSSVIRISWFTILNIYIISRIFFLFLFFSGGHRIFSEPILFGDCSKVSNYN